MQGNLHPGLRPYLAVMTDPHACDELDATVQAENQPIGAAILVTLDGAPERCRDLLATHSPEQDAQNRIRSKEDTFCRIVYSDLLYGRSLGVRPGILIDPPELPHNRWHASEGNRIWQDTCCAVFSGECSLHSGCLHALRIHQRLERHNHSERMSWNEELHARIGIGRTFSQAFACTLEAKRDQTVTTRETWNLLHEQIRPFLSLVNFRAAPF